MTRDLPHDITDALAAAAIAIESGLADAAAVAEALSTFEYPPHRIERVGEYDGVTWYNDSKATTPHAAITAIRGFDNVVLLAGGRNKGLDLASLALEHERVKAVVALGEAASIIRDAFARWCPVVEAALDASCRRCSCRSSRAQATPSCCPRPAQASTGTPTAATRRAATISNGWFTTTSGMRAR